MCSHLCRSEESIVFREKDNMNVMAYLAITCKIVRLGYQFLQDFVLDHLKTNSTHAVGPR